ncbi:MAG: hypothetical protein LBV51_05285, partial [Acholeplasmatales bacterium]|nr:hypothetical protein [Acholeplasmatales bacterium]
MKKIILLIVITVSSIIFVSCGKSKDVLKRALAGDVITYQSGDSALFVTKDITLQTQTTIDNKEVIFSWSSSSPAISENGKVTRPFSSFDTNVVLTVSASYNKSTRNKTFNLVVKKVNIEEALSIGYHNGDNAHSVTQNVTLPHIIQKDGYTAQVVWESYNSLILANDGTLNPDLIGSVDAVLKATVYGTEGQIFTKMFSLRVIGITLDLEIIYSNNENSTNVKHNLNLPESVFIKGEEHSVKWTSTKPDIISNTGIVNRPFGAPVTTTLGATINNTNMSWFIRYEVTVLGINTSLVEQNTNIIYKEGDTPQTITSNITLVKSAVIDDCLITFSYITDNENVIDANGNVTRRKTDSLVTMYVSAASGTHTYTFSYNLKVLKEE